MGKWHYLGVLVLEKAATSDISLVFVNIEEVLYE